MSRFAVTTLIFIGIGTVVAFALPFSDVYWVGSIYWACYMAFFISGLFLIRLNFFCPAVCRGRAGGMKIALTFDDGPDPRATPELLKLLRRENISATFFCIGSRVTAHPEVAAQIVEEGHLLENHSYTHPWYISMLMRKGLLSELSQTQEAIRRATGVMPKFFRPPSGMTGPNFSGALKKLGMTMVGWDVRSLDTVITEQKAVERILRLAKDGSIILLHDGGAPPDRIVNIVESAIRELKARGFGFERLDRMLGDGLTEIQLTNQS